MNKQMPAETLVVNLKMLLNKRKMKPSELARLSGVTERMIHYIINGERKASVEIAGKLADAFGLTGWQLIMPSLPYDLAKSGVLDKLINDYAHCTHTSQEYISHIAKHDAEYKTNTQ